MKNYENYKAAIDGLKAMCAEHNAALEDDEPQADVDKAVRSMRAAGGTNLDVVCTFTAADVEGFGIPKGIANLWVKRLAQSVTEAPGPTERTQGPQTVQIVSAEAEFQDASDEVLVTRLAANYDPNNLGRAGAELRRRAGTAAFLVFVDGKVDVGRSVERLRLIRANRPVTGTVTLSDGQIVSPIALGEPLKREMLRENFLYPGEPVLEPGNICAHTNEDLSDVPFDVQQLLYTAITIGELQVRDPENARKLIERAREPGALAVMRRRYPNAAVALDKMPLSRRPTLELDPSAGALRGRPFADAVTVEPNSVSRNKVDVTTCAKLDHELLVSVHKSALVLGLAGSRKALLTGLHPAIAAGLSNESNSSAQMLSDLDALNNARLEDGTSPVTVWLKNAIQLTGSRQEAEVFRRALCQCQGVGGGGDVSDDVVLDRLGRMLPAQFDTVVFKLRMPMSIISGSSAAQATRAVEVLRWAQQNGRMPDVCRLLGLEASSAAKVDIRALHKALLSAFPSRASLSELLRFELGKRLDEIAGNGNMNEVVFAVVTAAESQGWATQLVAAATRANPGNELLRALVR